VTLPDAEARSGANLAKAVHDYGRLAADYDRATRRIDSIRLRALAELGLTPGEIVLDAGCGTGWCIPHLAHAVGAGGTVIGFDPSVKMLAIARHRLAQAGASNARLLISDAVDIELPHAPHAILFSYTHDLLQSRAALDRVFAQAAPGARVVACGTKRFPALLWPANVYQRYSHRHYITNFEGLTRPWALLATYLEDFHVDSIFPGNKYLASGRLAPVYARTS
jgi:ubiquinone/menaquinone biosynthesis C-methylase UbiE